MNPSRPSKNSPLTLPCLSPQELQALASQSLTEIQRDETSLAQMEHLLGCETCHGQFSQLAEAHALLSETGTITTPSSSNKPRFSPLLLGVAALMLGGAGIAGAWGYRLGTHRPLAPATVLPIAPGNTVDTTRLNAIAHERDLYHTQANRLNEELKRLQTYKAQTSLDEINALAKRLPKPPSVAGLPAPDKIKLEVAQKALTDRGQQVALMQEVISVLRREVPVPDWARQPLISLSATPTFVFISAPDVKIDTFVLKTAEGMETLVPRVQEKPSDWKPNSPLSVGKWVRWEIKGTETTLPFTYTGRLKVLATDDADLKKRYANSPQMLTTLRELAKR